MLAHTPATGPQAGLQAADLRIVTHPEKGLSKGCCCCCCCREVGIGVACIAFCTRPCQPAGETPLPAPASRAAFASSRLSFLHRWNSHPSALCTTDPSGIMQDPSKMSPLEEFCSIQSKEMSRPPSLHDRISVYFYATGRRLSATSYLFVFLGNACLSCWTVRVGAVSAVCTSVPPAHGSVRR